MRPDLLNPLFAEVATLKGVGPQLERALARLGITRLIDLLFHLPASWIERRHVHRIAEANEGEMIAVGLVPFDYRTGGPRSPLRILARDCDGEVVGLTYFGKAGAFAKAALPLGEERLFCGRLERFGTMVQMVHPDHQAVVEAVGPLAIREPVYPLTEGLTSRRLQQLVGQALSRLPLLPEWIEPTLLERERWPGWADALRRLHEEGSDGTARERLAYDEIFANQLALTIVRASSRRRPGTPLIATGQLTGALRLPYAPTTAQQRAMQEIRGDMAQSTPMLRLLQGDVGSGKTLVALDALLVAVEAGVQGAFLAPTEILARQHFETVRSLAAGLSVTVALLTGRDKGKVRESVLMGLADGSIDILVGTHAIFQETVGYRRLGLVVVDEQHRFGVAQRLLLTRKADRPPHLLAMTATPIPRTLALAHYGEMDASRLDEMPPGRTPVDTRVIAAERIADVVEGLKRVIAHGGQAYWVCPLVEEGEADDRSAVDARAAMLRTMLGDAVGLVHGRMKGPEKDRVMERFSAGEIAVLVATTVIEVGVDVPNASLIVIENAERFGLAQLHQLRGRVGRGNQRSTCILLRGTPLSETARARLALMRRTNDGFLIAEEDLRLRGAGEMLGTRQSGEGRYRLADAAHWQRWIAAATDDARLLMDRDGGLNGQRGEASRAALYLFERDAGIATLRSG